MSLATISRQRIKAGIKDRKGGELVANAVDRALVSREVTYTEDGAGTYTGAVEIPEGATVVNIIVHATALWTAATSASMEVGDGNDPDGYFTAVDLKATDLLAGESIDFAKTGGVEGAYLVGTATHWKNRYYASGGTITGTVVSVGAGTAGRTRMTVIYSNPTPTAAM